MKADWFLYGPNTQIRSFAIGKPFAAEISPAREARA
jgi:hypothetical protein